MDKEKLKKDILIYLKSVILSCKGGVPVNTLQRDYRNLVGTNIPFENLGYPSLQDFIQDVSDIIKLKKNDDGELIAEVVAERSTIHLAKLISKQRDAKYNKKSKRNYFATKTPVRIRWASCLKEKNKEIKHLEMELQKEKELSKNCLIENAHLKSLLQVKEKYLCDKQKVIRNLEYQLQIIQGKGLTPKLQWNDIFSQYEIKIKKSQDLVQKLKQQVETLHGVFLLKCPVFINALKDVNDMIVEIWQKIGILKSFLDSIAIFFKNLTAHISTEQRHYPHSANLYHDFEQQKDTQILQNDFLKNLQNQLDLQFQAPQIQEALSSLNMSGVVEMLAKGLQCSLSQVFQNIISNTQSSTNGISVQQNYNSQSVSQSELEMSNLSFQWNRFVLRNEAKIKCGQDILRKLKNQVVTLHGTLLLKYPAYINVSKDIIVEIWKHIEALDAVLDSMLVSLLNQSVP